jgi:P4 family phage/plasmid primase-like protien
MDRIKAQEVALSMIDETIIPKSIKNNVEKKAKEVFNNRMNEAEQFYDSQPIYYDDAGLFWLWDKETKSWFRIRRDEDIANLIQDSIGVNTIDSKERNEIFQALKQVGRKYKPIPLQKTWIQFKNGIIDLKEPYVVREASPEYFTVNPIPWNIGKTDSTPVMDKIFEEWVGKDYVKTLYQILAYCLLSDYPIHRLFCFIGAGMNGKSKFLELLRIFIGDNNVTSTELDTLLSSRFEVTRLHKKLVCQMGETNFNEMSKTSILKKLTGQDLIGFEYKNKDPFEDKNTAKILISTNNLPTTTDKTIGFYRRWLIIDFPNQFSEKKDILADIPLEEYENLCLKSIKILNELLEAKEFHNEGDIETRMKKYEDHSDPLEKFIKEYTIEDLNGKIWKFDFEKKLNQWCQMNRFRQLSEVAIGKKMKEKGIQQQQITSDWLIDGTHKLLRAWIGLTWNDKSSVNTTTSQDSQDSQVIRTQFSRIGSELNSPVNPVNPVNGGNISQ